MEVELIETHVDQVTEGILDDLYGAKHLEEQVGG